VSFGKEVKDFLGAATSTYKTLSDADYNKLKGKYLQAQIDNMPDEEDDANSKEHARLQNQALRNNNALQGQRSALLGAQIKSYEPQPPPAFPVPPAGPGARAVQAGGDYMADDGSVPAVGYANGGVVQETLPMQQAQPRGPVAGAIPTGSADPQDDEDDEDDEDDNVTPVATDISARRRTPNYDAGIDAVHQGLIHNVQRFGLHTRSGVQDAQRQRAVQLYAQGYGAVPPEVMQEVYKKVDPDGTMTDGERNIAALGAVWKDKIARNDLAGAREAAADMLQHYKIMSQRYAAIAAAAVHHGDIDGAAKAAMAAYGQIPDGKDLHVVKTPDGQLAYQFKDIKTGNVLQRGIASPDQLAGAAMNVATKGFEPLLMQAAGERAAPPPKGAVGDKAMKPRDATEIRKGIDKHADDQFDSLKDSGANVTDTEKQALKNGAFHIAQLNPSLAPSEAFDAAKTFITAPEPKKGADKAFTIERDEDTGKNTVTFGDTGRAITLSDAELRPLMALRGKAIKERTDTEKAGEGKKSVGEKVDKLAKDSYDAVTGPGGPTEAIGVTASAAGRGIKRAAQAVGDVVINPYVTRDLKAARDAVMSEDRPIGNPMGDPQ
jgi:hypothetical protein